MPQVLSYIVVIATVAALGATTYFAWYSYCMFKAELERQQKRGGECHYQWKFLWFRARLHVEPYTDKSRTFRPGLSSDRRRAEIARAKAGLPPADNLEGMFTSDIRKVKKARTRYGTARS